MAPRYRYYMEFTPQEIAAFWESDWNKHMVNTASASADTVGEILNHHDRNMSRFDVGIRCSTTV